MATGVQVWSKVPVTNATADSNINWAEGMPPSAVDDSARAMMASVADWRDDNSGSLVTSGTSTAFTVATNQVAAANTAGNTVKVFFNQANGAASTLAVDGNAALPLQVVAGTAASSGFFAAGSIWGLTLSTTGTGQWIAQGASVTGGSSAPIGSSFTASLASSVSMSTASFTDGPSVSAATTGVWFVSGTVTMSGFGSLPQIALKLWDGTTSIALTEFTVTATNHTASLSGVLSAPAGNLRISGQVNTGSGTGGFISGISITGSSGLYSTVTAVRIA